MKMLVVAPHPFFTPRGTPFSVYYRTLVTAEQGVEIDLLTYGPGQDVDIPGIRIVRIPRVPGTEPVPIGPSWQKLLLDGPMILWTIGMLLRGRYEVVHAHEESVFWCRFLRPLFRFRLVYDMHSSLPQQLENFRFTRSRLLIGLFKALENSCVTSANAVITVCPVLTQHALALGANPERVLLIENLLIDDVQLSGEVDGEHHVPGGTQHELWPGHPVILYAGTFEPYQGVDVLIQAFARVVARRPDARLLLVGGNNRQVAAMRKLADSLGLTDSCMLTGQVPRKAAMTYARKSRVVVSLRMHGGNTPMKVYELLASGRPMVATRVLAHTQVLDDEVSFLVEPDPDSIADGLLAALDDGPESARRVSNALARFEREYARTAYEQKIRRVLALVG